MWKGTHRTNTKKMQGIIKRKKAFEKKAIAPLARSPHYGGKKKGRNRYSKSSGGGGGVRQEGEGRLVHKRLRIQQERSLPRLPGKNGTQKKKKKDDEGEGQQMRKRVSPRGRPTPKRDGSQRKEKKQSLGEKSSCRL